LLQAFPNKVLAIKVVLGELTDKGLSELFKFKSEHEGKFGFAPNSIQPAPQNKYNNITLSWKTFEGMQTVLKIVEKLHAEHST
jgi:hypothetical protein